MLKKSSAIFISFLMACSTSAWTANEDSIQIKGSDTMVNLVQGWAEEYMKNDPNAFIAVTGGGSGTGLASLISGTCDLAASSREIKKQEIELARKKGVEPKEIKVALDGLAVVVNPSNPVSQLTEDQLAAIFSGQITNWKEVGGPDLAIVVLSREVNSGTHVYFKEHILRKNDPKSRVEFSPNALLLPSSQAIADETSQNTGVIGYYGMGYLSSKQKSIAVARDASSPFEEPTVANVISGAYPISRPLYFYSKGEPQGIVKEFLDYVLSPEGQAEVSKMDFVPVKK